LNESPILPDVNNDIGKKSPTPPPGPNSFKKLVFDTIPSQTHILKFAKFKLTTSTVEPDIVI
jgi:hypothetical protein